MIPMSMQSVSNHRNVGNLDMDEFVSGADIELVGSFSLVPQTQL